MCSECEYVPEHSLGNFLLLASNLSTPALCPSGRSKITGKAKEITAALSHLLATTEGHEEHALIVLTILAKVRLWQLTTWRHCGCDGD